MAGPRQFEENPNEVFFIAPHFVFATVLLSDVVLPSPLRPACTQPYHFRKYVDEGETIWIERLLRGAGREAKDHKMRAGRMMDERATMQWPHRHVRGDCVWEGNIRPVVGQRVRRTTMCIRECATGCCCCFSQLLSSSKHPWGPREKKSELWHTRALRKGS